MNSTLKSITKHLYQEILKEDANEATENQIRYKTFITFFRNVFFVSDRQIEKLMKNALPNSEKMISYEFFASLIIDLIKKYFPFRISQKPEDIFEFMFFCDIFTPKMLIFDLLSCGLECQSPNSSDFNSLFRQRFIPTCISTLFDYDSFKTTFDEDLKSIINGEMVERFKNGVKMFINENDFEISSLMLSEIKASLHESQVYNTPFQFYLQSIVAQELFQVWMSSGIIIKLFSFLDYLTNNQLSRNQTDSIIGLIFDLFSLFVGLFKYQINFEFYQQYLHSINSSTEEVQKMINLLIDREMEYFLKETTLDSFKAIVSIFELFQKNLF